MAEEQIVFCLPSLSFVQGFVQIGVFPRAPDARSIPLKMPLGEEEELLKGANET